MPVIHLDSLDDPRLADYRAIRDPELLRARHLFLAEGRLVVERLLATRRYTIRSLLLSDAAYAALGPTLAQERQPRAPSPPVDPTDLSLSPRRFSRPHRRGHPSRLSGAGRAAAHCPPSPKSWTGASTVVVLEGVANPDNVGGIFRNAAAFGVDAVLLSPTSCDPFYRKAIRTSMAATLHVPFARVAPWPDGLAALRDEGIRDCRADAPRAVADPRRLCDCAAAGPAGAAPRRRGRRPQFARPSGWRTSGSAFPSPPHVDSLNVTVAAGIALARLAARPRAEREGLAALTDAGILRHGDHRFQRSFATHRPRRIRLRPQDPRAQQALLPVQSLADLDLRVLHRPRSAHLRSLRARVRRSHGAVARRRPGRHRHRRPPRRAARVSSPGRTSSGSPRIGPIRSTGVSATRLPGARSSPLPSSTSPAWSWRSSPASGI